MCAWLVTGAVKFSRHDDEDSLDYLVLNSNDDTLLRLRRLHVIYDLALCKTIGIAQDSVALMLASVTEEQGTA